MEGNSDGQRVLASLQAPGYESDPVRGHRGQGFLADRDLVCVPSLARSLLDEAGGYEVLLVPDACSGSQPPERQTVSSVEVVSLAGADDVVAFFRLAVPSGLYAPANRTISSNAEFFRALRALDGNLWDLAENHGLGAPPFRGDPSEMLACLGADVTRPAPCITVQICSTQVTAEDNICCRIGPCC